MSFINQKTTVLIVIFFFLLISGYTQETLESKIDSLLEAKYKPNDPGAVAMVSQKGNILYQKAFGKANLELDVPMTTENVFEIGSMTKQFTAISILMLMEQGKLKLDDYITKYIPEYPMHGQKITIHHLLTHTSGIKRYTSMKSLRDIAKNDLTPKELVDFFKNEPMEFDAGEQFKYNNSGYIILGYIIEIISGKSYADFIEENIFEPLEMHSSLYASHSKIILNRAYGYQSKDNDYKNAMYISLTLPYSSGSLMSTTKDLLNWQQGLKNSKLISHESLEKAFTNYTLNNGSYIDYGYGWNIKNILGVTTYEHGGSIFGFKSMSVYIPSDDIYVVILTNCDCNSPTKITKQIAETIITNFKIN